MRCSHDLRELEEGVFKITGQLGDWEKEITGVSPVS